MTKTCKYCSKKLKAHNRSGHCRSLDCKFIERNGYKREILNCRICGKKFTENKRSEGFCSKKCKQNSHIVIVDYGNCKQCGKLMTIIGKPTKKFCSIKCGSKYERSLRITDKDKREKWLTYRIKRYRKISGAIKGVDKIKVFERADYKCCNCGIRCNTIQNSPKQATLDHIIPLSKGGEHSYKNTQLLCRKCNVRKNDKIAV